MSDCRTIDGELKCGPAAVDNKAATWSPDIVVKPHMRDKHMKMELKKEKIAGTDIDAVLDWEHKAYDKCGVRKSAGGKHTIEYPKAERKDARDTDVPLLIVVLCDIIEAHVKDINSQEVEKYLTNQVTKSLQKAIMSLEKRAIEKNRIRGKIERQRNPGDLAWCLLVQFLENTFVGDPLFPRRCQTNLLSIFKLYYWYTKPNSDVPSDDWLYRVNEWFSTPRKTLYLKQLIYLMHQVNADAPSRYGTLRRIFKACKACSDNGTNFEKIALFCEIVNPKLFNADPVTDSIHRPGFADRGSEDACGWGGEFDQLCAEARRQCFLVCVAHYDAIFDNKSFEDEHSISLPLPEHSRPEMHTTELMHLVSPLPCVTAVLAVASCWVVEIYEEKNRCTQSAEPTTTDQPHQIGNSTDFEVVPSEVSQYHSHEKNVSYHSKTPTAGELSSSPKGSSGLHDDSTAHDATRISRPDASQSSAAGKGSGNSSGQNTTGRTTVTGSSGQDTSQGKSPGLPKNQSHNLLHPLGPEGQAPSQGRSYQGSKVSDHSVVSMTVSQEVLDIINDTDVRSRATDATALRNADKIKQLSQYLKMSEERFVQSELAQRQLADACKELERRLEDVKGAKGLPAREELGLRQSQLSQHTHQLLDIENEVISLRRENRELTDEVAGLRRDMKRERAEGDRELRETRKEVSMLRGGMKAISEAMEGFQEEMEAMRGHGGRVTDDLENAMLREELSRVRHDADMMRVQLQELQEHMLRMERNIRTHGYEGHITPKRASIHHADLCTSSSSSSSTGYHNMHSYSRLIADDNLLNAKLTSLQYQLS